MLDLVLVLLAAIWCYAVLGAMRGLRALQELPPFDQRPTASVAVVVPICDGGDGLGATLEALSGQHGVDLRFVPVDDRSTDGTAEVLRGWAARDGRVHCVTVQQLPPGWIGKCHACQRGAEAAGETDWLLFVDDDTWLEPLTIARAVREAERTEVDHLCLIPQLRGLTAGGALPALSMCLALMGQVDKVTRGADAMGVGAFTLVRREAWRAMGGHEALRMTVVDDMQLARRLLRNGHRTALRFAPRVFSVEWITTLAGGFRVLEKNLFAALGCRTLPIALLGVLLLVGWVVTLVAAFGGRWAGLLAAAALLGHMLPGVLVARRYGWRASRGLLAPLGPPVVAMMMLNSVVRVWLRGGVTWRGVFYPLAELRRGFCRA